MKEKKSGGFIERLATFIVDKRNQIFLLYIFAFVFCIKAMGWVYVENDVTAYLPEGTETRLGVEAMNRNFKTYGMGQIMVSNVSFETAQELADEIAAVEGVTMVTFDDTPEHYSNAAALFDVNFDGGNFDEISTNALAEIREMLAPYDTAFYTQVGYDENSVMRGEMLVILIVAVIIIFIVMTLTSRAYMEVPVLLMTFAAAALLNMGTNFILGTISFISDAVATVLQLALAIDYAIILCHRFTDEHETKDARESAIIALSKAIPEISASSLTTIGGLFALSFMEFGIGRDMSYVLVKAIFMSLLSVFTLMPGLLVLFCPLLDKTRHKKLLPNIDFVGKFAVKTRRVLPILFTLSLIGAYYLSSNAPFAYSYNKMKSTKMSELQISYFEILDNFGETNMFAILVPRGNYEAEGKILAELNTLPEVKNTMGLAGIEAMEGHMLTDALNPRELSELLGMDIEVVQLLYSAYAVENDQYGELLSGLEEYRVPLFDMFIYLKEQMDSRNIDLGSMAGEMGGMLDQLDMAKEQMQSEEYSRMVVYINLPEEGQRTYDFLQQVRDIIGQYYEDDYYLVGNSTSSRDLAASFERDNMLISVLSALFVILILLFTFRSAGLPILLILVIQGSIWINFSIPTLTNTPLYFLGYMIVVALQMGANIDYAIVISSHYQEEKAHYPHKEAIIHAVNSAFPTVFTSGIMLSTAGLLIGNMTAQPVIAILGTCIGRGTAISVVLVLFVLPSILVLGDSIIERTRFHVKGLEPRERRASGVVRVQGRIRGHISGYVDAEIRGVIRGDVSAAVSTGGQLIEEGDSEDEE